MRYILAILPWDLPSIAPLNLPAFLETVKGMGFDGISLIVRLHQIDKMEQVIVPAQQVRDAGMELLLRVVADTSYAEWVPLSCRLQDVSAGDDGKRNGGGGLNIFNPDAKPIMRLFCEKVRKSGLLDLASAVSIGWTSSFEVDAMAWCKDWWYARTDYQRYVYRDAIRTMIWNAITTLKASVPIGGQRGSFWHMEDFGEEQRMVRPMSGSETGCFVGDCWWDKREHLLTSCRIVSSFITANPKGFAVNEWDFDGWNKWNEDGKWSDLPWQDEMLARFRILKENGVAAQVIHCSPADLMAHAETFAAAGRIMSQ